MDEPLLRHDESKARLDFASSSSQFLARPSLSGGSTSRRRTFHARRDTGGDDDINQEAAVLRLDLVLDKLERRLKEYDQSGLQFDGKVRQAYDILRTIFLESANRVGLEEAKGRAGRVVKVLENKCLAVLSAKDTVSLPDKIQGARKYIEATLLDMESAYYHKVNSTRQTVAEKITNLQSELSKGTKEAQIRVEKIKIAIQEASTRLLTFDELPWEWQNNPYILKGYRFYESPVQCAISAFQIHNETGNIWTHLFGFFFLCTVGLYLYPRTTIFAEDMNLGDRIVFFVFLGAALKCLACSALWHTFAHIANLKAMKHLACLDYVGISVLIAASIVTMEYHGFYCSPKAQIGYVGFTSAFGLLGVIIPWFEWFDVPKNRPYRIMFFLGIAISGAVPLSHVVLTQGIKRSFLFYAPVLKSLLCYASGVAIYASNYPERLCPGVFERVGLMCNMPSDTNEFLSDVVVQSNSPLPKPLSCTSCDQMSVLMEVPIKLSSKTSL